MDSKFRKLVEVEAERLKEEIDKSSLIIIRVPNSTCLEAIKDLSISEMEASVNPEFTILQSMDSIEEFGRHGSYDSVLATLMALKGTDWQAIINGVISDNQSEDAWADTL